MTQLTLKHLDEQGMALISAMLLILIVSLMAVGISANTSMDVRISGYQKFKAISFGCAEAAANTSAEILEDNIYDAGWKTAAEPFSYPGLSSAYNGTIMIEDKDFYMHSNHADPAATVIRMTGPVGADIAVQKTASKLAKGSAIQVSTGYEGVARGMGGGGVHLIYNIQTRGYGSNSAESVVGQHYRHVTK